jgi:hypothetical protein
MRCKSINLTAATVQNSMITTNSCDKSLTNNSSNLTWSYFMVTDHQMDALLVIDSYEYPVSLSRKQVN